MAKRVLILATNGFEQSELTKPKANLEKAGIETTVVSLESGEIIEFFDDTIERRQREIAEEHGFELVDHALVLYVRPKGSKVTRQEGAGPGKK